MPDNYTVTRRDFLLSSATGAIALAWIPGASAAQRGLEQFLKPAPACTDDLTPAVSDAGTFRPGAPARRSIAGPDTPGTPLALSGYVVGLKCGRIGGARLDFWQPDALGGLDADGFRLRAQQRTEADGRYRLETIVPGAPRGRAPFIGVRLQPPNGPVFTTRLFLPDHRANARDPEFTAKLVLKRAAAGAFTFDFLLDL